MSTTANPTSPHRAPYTRRHRLGQTLAGLAALGAAISALAALWSLGGVEDATKIVETWRAYGLVVFSALFALLALRPRAYRGVWEIAIFHKLAMTVTALVYLAQGGVVDAGTIVVSDGILSVVLVAAYLLCRGWTAEPEPLAQR